MYLKNDTSNNIMTDTADNNKILICLTGHIRTFSHTIDSLLLMVDELVKRNYNVDICFSTYDVLYGYHPYIKSVLKFYKDKNIDIDSYFNYIESVFSDRYNNSVVGIETYNNKLLYTGGNNTGGNNIKSIVKSAKVSLIKPFVHNMKHEEDECKKILHPTTKGICNGFLSNNRLIDCINHKENTSENTSENKDQSIDPKTNKYLYIIKTRFDVIYNIECMKEIFDRFVTLDESIIYIDNDNTFPNDWIIISSHNNMVKLSLHIKSEYINPTSELSISNHPHGFLQHFIETNKLNICTGKLITTICRYSPKLDTIIKNKNINGLNQTVLDVSN